MPRKAGAVVRSERQQGKGHVVRRMFADIDADIYVMADGDLTYDPQVRAGDGRSARLPSSSTWWSARAGTTQKDAYRGGHVLGNRLFTGLSPACSGAASATFFRATEFSRGAS